MNKTGMVVEGVVCVSVIAMFEHSILFRISKFGFRIFFQQTDDRGPRIEGHASEVREHQIRNSKHETRPVLHSLGEGGNKFKLPKTNDRNDAALSGALFLCFGHFRFRTFDIISDFEIRISDFLSRKRTSRAVRSFVHSYARACVRIGRCDGKTIMQSPEIRHQRSERGKCISTDHRTTDPRQSGRRTSEHSINFSPLRVPPIDVRFRSAISESPQEGPPPG